ncbi:uncharacterized protein Bfra_003572 [Botrytis fragariae]|uniref:Uncharacterized protein n=1 Tax=Botrytis fragariae TaxID=1964551 RepID=A0A8H6AX47_9HELO|nr:uncharacterized protein Bfra_003572 [Botrytis fragariae]KAF5875119.1 hypothetical protein Bfra_003572 [Botrytis fragariae]
MEKIVGMEITCVLHQHVLNLILEPTHPQYQLFLTEIMCTNMVDHRGRD